MAFLYAPLSTGRTASFAGARRSRTRASALDGMHTDFVGSGRGTGRPETRGGAKVSETADTSHEQRTAPRVSLAERAYREVKRRILDNDMPAGTMVLESELTDLLGMSRTPVREALMRLAREGMIEVRPRHGMRVLPVSPEDMAEIYQILTALESEAAAQIAREGLSAEQLAALRRILTDMDEALDADDLRRWADGDDRFHKVLLDCCANKRLRGIILQFWEQAYRVRMLTLRLRPKPTASNRDHHQLVEAIARGDAETAQRIHHEHRIRNGRMLVGILRELGLTQL